MLCNYLVIDLLFSCYCIAKMLRIKRNLNRQVSCVNQCSTNKMIVFRVYDGNHIRQKKALDNMLGETKSVHDLTLALFC